MSVEQEYLYVADIGYQLVTCNKSHTAPPSDKVVSGQFENLENGECVVRISMEYY